MKMKFASIAAPIALGCLLTATPAFAQDEQAKNTTNEVEFDDIIVVTAQKRGESINDVPISIAAFSGEALESSNVVTVNDLGTIVPNFSVSRAAAATSVRLSIRGVGAAGNTATEPSVAAFLDGVYIPRAGSVVGSFLDIASVEVLRGPQGTLFGRNASVGAVSLRSAEPEFDFSGAVTGELQNYDRYRVAGHVNLPVSDNIALRVAGQGRWSDGFWENQFDGQTYGQQDDHAFRASLKADLGAVDWIVRGDYSKITGDGVTNTDFDASTVSAAQLAGLRGFLGGQLPDTNLDDRVLNQVIVGDLYDRQWGVMSDLSLEVGSGTLRLVNSYRDWTNEQLDGDVVFLPVSLLTRVGNFDSRSHNHELQYISPKNEWIDGRLDLVAGLYYFGEKYRLGEDLNLQGQFCNVLVPPGGPRTACNNYLATTGGFNSSRQTMTQQTDSFAAYGQLNFRLFDPLTLVLGGRWTKEDKSGTYSQIVNTPFITALRAPEVLTLPDLSESRFTYRIGLNFEPTDDMLIFGSYSTGYKSGGYNSGGGTPSLTTFAPDGSVVSTKRVFDRETVNNYELGIKASWLDRALQTNLTAFRMDINGFQDRSFDGTSFLIRNAGSLRQQGFEFDAVIRPDPSFTVNLALAYLDSEFTDFTGGTALPGFPAGTIQDLTGTPANFSPKFNGRVGFNWNGNFGDSEWGWQLNSNLSFVSDQRNGGVTDNNPQTIEDGYALLGARFTINAPSDRFSVSVFGTNLTNEAYATQSFNQVLGGALGLNNGVFPGSTAIRRIRAEPRSYGVAGTFRF